MFAEWVVDRLMSQKIVKWFWVIGILALAAYIMYLELGDTF